MTTEQQRIAIAEACGCPPLQTDKGETADAAFPDYLTDLNAMHEAEKVLTYPQLTTYHEIVCQIIACQKPPQRHTAHDFLFHATAAQRAEAFLRTIGRWERD